MILHQIDTGWNGRIMVEGEREGRKEEGEKKREIVREYQCLFTIKCCLDSIA